MLLDDGANKSVILLFSFAPGPVSLTLPRTCGELIQRPPPPPNSFDGLRGEG